MDARTGFRIALKDSIPVFFSYFPLGVVYGLLFEHEGFPWWLAPLTSALIYGGSVQLLALGMMSAGTSILTLLIAITPVALRNSFYTIGVLDRLENHSLSKKLWLSFGLVDATFAIIATRKKEDCGLNYWTPLNMLIYLYWVVGSLIGAFCGSFIDQLPPGLEFSLTALFVVLAIENYKSNKLLFPFIVGALAVITASLIAPNHTLLVGLLVSIPVLFYQAYRGART